MLSPGIVTEVRRLLAETTLSQRAVARKLRISRGSVGAIASGKRCNRPVDTEPEDEDADKPAGPPRRCPGCGHLVYMPCVLCRLRRTLRKTPSLRRPLSDAFVPSIELALRPEHQAAYEEVCAQRRVAEAEARNNGSDPHLPQPGDCRELPRQFGACFTHMGTVPLVGSPLSCATY